MIDELVLRLEHEGVKSRTDMTEIKIEKVKVEKPGKKKKLKDLFKTKYSVTVGFKDTQNNITDEGNRIKLTPKNSIWLSTVSQGKRICVSRKPLTLISQRGAKS